MPKFTVNNVEIEFYPAAGAKGAPVKWKVLVGFGEEGVCPLFKIQIVRMVRRDLFRAEKEELERLLASAQWNSLTETGNLVEIAEFIADLWPRLLEATSSLPREKPGGDAWSGGYYD